MQSCNQMHASYLFQQDKHYDLSYDTGDKALQCGRHVDVFKLWLMWRAKVSMCRSAEGQLRAQTVSGDPQYDALKIDFQMENPPKLSVFNALPRYLHSTTGKNVIKPMIFFSF